MGNLAKAGVVMFDTLRYMLSHTDHHPSIPMNEKCLQNMRQAPSRIGLNKSVETSCNSAQVCSKTLPINHEQLRIVRNVNKDSLCCSMPHHRNTSKAGDQIEVYSSSHNAWCSGHVEKINGRMLFLTFRSPDAIWVKKWLPCDHSDV